MVMLLSRIFDFIGLKKDYCLVFFQVVLQSLIFTDCLPLKTFKCTLITQHYYKLNFLST